MIWRLGCESWGSRRGALQAWSLSSTAGPSTVHLHPPQGRKQAGERRGGLKHPAPRAEVGPQTLEPPHPRDREWGTHTPGAGCRRGFAPASPHTCTRRAGRGPPVGETGRHMGQEKPWGSPDLAAWLWEQRSGGSGILHPASRPLHPLRCLLPNAPHSGPQGLRTAHLSLDTFQLYQVFPLSLKLIVLSPLGL